MLLTDQNGQPLHVGDRVLIPAVVTMLCPTHTLLNLEVQLELSTGGEVGYRPVVGLNARQVRLNRLGRRPGSRKEQTVAEQEIAPQ